MPAATPPSPLPVCVVWWCGGGGVCVWGGVLCKGMFVHVHIHTNNNKTHTHNKPSTTHQNYSTTIQGNTGQYRAIQGNTTGQYRAIQQGNTRQYRNTITSHHAYNTMHNTTPHIQHHTYIPCSPHCQCTITHLGAMQAHTRNLSHRGVLIHHKSIPR